MFIELVKERRLQMTEALSLLVGLLSGGIITYFYMRSKGIEITQLYTDSLLKNQLLKQELTKAPKKKSSNWKGQKRYHGKKRS